MKRSIAAFRLVALCAWASAALAADDLPRLEATVDLTGGSSTGRIPVTVTVVTANENAYFFKESGKPGEYTFHDVRFEDSAGATIPHRLRNRRYDLDRFAGNLVRATYEVSPGGPGRHGAQGVVAESYAMFDGRVYLVPREISELRSADVRMIVSDGWTVVSPFRSAGGRLHVDGVTPETIGDTLVMSCVGAGRLKTATKRFGNTEVRVGSVAEWDDEYTTLLAERTFALFEHYHQRYGFDLGSPYAVVWTPRVDSRRVYGGAYSNGTCYDHPTDSRRDWQLLAHRLAHSLNKYVPSGMWIRDAADSWFKEGWPTYMEVTATHATGIAPDESHWNSVFLRYESLRERHPNRDLAPRDDPLARGDTLEFMHYTKAPLIVKMLEFFVRERSGKELEPFMAEMWRTYGWQRRPFPFREELERWSGADYDDFWSLWIDRAGPVIPVWPEFVTDRITRAMAQAPAATVGDERISAAYLHYLARSGDFERFDDIRAFVEHEVRRRGALEAAGIRLYPPVIRAHLYALPPSTRYSIARIEADYPRRTAHDDSGPRFTVNTDSLEGRLFARLLSLEAGYLTSLPAGGLSSLRVRAGSDRPGAISSPPRLGFDSASTLVVQADWLVPPTSARFSILDGARAITRTWTMQLEPGWNDTWSTIDPSHRPLVDGIVLVQVAVGDNAIERAFWQRGSGGRRRSDTAPARPERTRRR